MRKELVERVEELIKERDAINKQLQEIAKSVDPTKPWKVVLRTDIGVVI